VSLSALVWAALAITAAGSLSAYLLSVRRIYLVRVDRRHLAGQERLALVAAQLADGELPEAELTEADVELVAELLARYSRQLTGAARSNIADFFECHGLVGREISHLADRRSWRRARAAFLLGDMSSPQALAPLLAALAENLGYRQLVMVWRTLAFVDLARRRRGWGEMRRRGIGYAPTGGASKGR
jgi:hypothetical protein